MAAVTDRSTPGSSPTSSRDDPISIWPVRRGWTLNAI
jgi:hypothetical protein